MKQFQVFSKMADDNNQALKFAPLTNIKGARKWTHGLGIVEIVVDEQTVMDLITNNLVGGFIIADAVEFEKTSKEVEELNDLVKKLLSFEPYNRGCSHSIDERRNELIEKIKKIL